MLQLTWDRVAAWRVRRQFLDPRASAGNLLAVAGRLCGLHAQVLSSAELTAWARINNLDRTSVLRALWEERKLVKTWAMRGTLHLLPAGDLPMWHAALATNRHLLRPGVWQKYFGITLDELDRVTEAIGAALEGRLADARRTGCGSSSDHGIASHRRQGGRQQLGHNAAAGRIRGTPVLRAGHVAGFATPVMDLNAATCVPLPHATQPPCAR